MKEMIEKKLAAAMLEKVPTLMMSRGSHDGGEIADQGTSLVVSVDVEHRAGPASLAEAVFRLETVAGDQAGDSAAIALEIRKAVQEINGLDCGGGVRLVGRGYWIGSGGGVDENRWVSEIKFRFGVLEG